VPQQVDVRDVWREFRNKPPEPSPIEEGVSHLSVAIVPILGSNPTSGVTFGAGGQIAFKGDEGDISSGITSLTFSTRGYVSLIGRYRVLVGSGRWLIEGDNRLQAATQTTYGFGAATPSSAGVDATYNFMRIYETVSRRIARDVYLGGGLLFDAHTDVQPAQGAEAVWSDSPYVAYATKHGLPINDQRSGGVSANVQFDGRDNPIDARTGLLASAVLRASFEGFLGGDSSWQDLRFDLRAYQPVGGGGAQRLALWFYGDLVLSGVAPYFDTPATVGDTFGRSARGYREGRYRGERLLDWEAEYRSTLTANGLLGAVVFASATTVSNLESGERLFHAFAPAGGAGLRLSVDKHTRTNLCLDFAWGKAGAWGAYLAIQEAF
jgi:outer membrane protein assembly factor BamA